MRPRRHAPAVMGPARHRPAPSFRWLLLLLVVLVVLSTQAAGFMLPAPGARAAGPIKMPFAAGSEWYISQGYNTSPAEGWSHYNCDPRTGKDQISKSESCEDGWQYKYSFDLRQVDGTEAGEIALSPVSGTIRWLDPANGGMSINMGDGFAIGIFHLDLARGLAEGQPVSLGQPLGSVAGPGGGNNGGTPHIHLNLWATDDGGNWSRNAAPFTGQHALDGYDFPDLGNRTQNQHWNTVVVSTNQQVGELPGAATPEATPEAPATGATPVAPPPAEPTATLTLAAARVIVGTPLTLNGAGFAPGEWVDIYWGSRQAMPITEVTANDSGAWTTALIVPEAVAGPHRIFATGADSGRRVRGTVEVIPALGREPVGGPAGSQVALSVTGFAALEMVDVHWGGESGEILVSFSTDEVGSGGATIMIPAGSAGAVELAAIGQSSHGRAVATIAVDGATAASPVAGGAILGPGTFQVTATVIGLVGGSTSSGHVIQPNDRLVALPACTTTSCPWLLPGVADPLFGSRIECGDFCFVRVTNPVTGQCAVAPVLETGPWFTLDDWWNPAETRMINTLPTTVQPLGQGYPAATAAQDGLDVGFGLSPSGIGLSNKGYEVGNRAAIDLATGTWQDIGFDPSAGIGEVVVTLLWLTGEDPASAGAVCGAATPATPPVASPPATTPAAAEPAPVVATEPAASFTPEGAAPESPQAGTEPAQASTTDVPPAADPAAPAADTTAPPPTDTTAPPPTDRPEGAPGAAPAADAGAAPPADTSAVPSDEAREDAAERNARRAERKGERVRERFGR